VARAAVRRWLRGPDELGPRRRPGDLPGEPRRRAAGAGGRRVVRAPGRPARGPPAHRRGRLHGLAQLLDRLRPGGGAGVAGGAASGRGRGVAVPDLGRAGGGRPGAARSRRRALRLAGGPRRAAAADRRRLGGGAVPVDAGAPPAVRQRCRGSPAVRVAEPAGRARCRRAGPGRPAGAGDAGLQPIGARGLAGPDRPPRRRCLAEHVWGPAARPQTFVCGPTGFVEAVAGGLVQLGHVPTSIKTERYGDAA
jgi:hypothetical protein